MHLTPKEKYALSIYSGHYNYTEFLRIFFHPDYTVGIGISPIRRNALADFTAGGESHPALKILVQFLYRIAQGKFLVNTGVL